MSLVSRRELMLKLIDNKQLAKTAAEALQNIDSKLSINSLIESLAISNKPARIRILYSLGKIGGEQALEAILTSWNPIKEEDERATAARALRELNDPAVTKFIWSIFQSENSLVVKIELLKIIKQWKDRRGLSILLKDLSQNSPDYLVEIINTIGTLGDGRAEKYLLNFLKIKHTGILQATIEALGKLY